MAFLCCLLWFAGLSCLYAQAIVLESPQTLPTPTENVQKLRYSPEGNFIGALVLEKTLLLYDSEGQHIRQYSAPLQSAWADFAFAPDEQHLALVLHKQDSTFLQLYALQGGELIETLFLFEAQISAMEWHKDGYVLMIASESHELQAWQMIDRKLRRAHQKNWDKKELDEAWVFASTANGRLWAMAGVGSDMLIYEWKKQDLNLRQTLKISEPVFGLAFHTLEPKLYISTANCIKGYQYQKRDWLKTDSLPTRTPIASQLQMLKGNRGLATVQENCLILYGRQGEGRLEMEVLFENEAQILAHAPHPRLSHWVVATADGKVRLFRVREAGD